MAHCQFLPREDTVAVANDFVQPIDVNIDTVTASLVVRQRTPIRAKIEVPSPVTAPPAAPSPRRTVAGSPRASICVSHTGLQILETALSILVPCRLSNISVEPVRKPHKVNRMYDVLLTFQSQKHGRKLHQFNFFFIYNKHDPVSSTIYSTCWIGIKLF